MRCEGTHTVRKILNRQYNELIKGHLVSDLGTPKLTNRGLAPLAARAHLHNICSLPGFFRHVVKRAELGLSSLLDASLSEIAQGRIIPAFLCLRAIIEHVAHGSQWLHGEQLKINFEATPRGIADQLVKIQETILKAAYPTRTGWKNIISGEAPIRTQKKLKYTPDEDRVNLTAKSILNAIDELETRVIGVRNVYEVLCEFAHPNGGARFAVTEHTSLEPEVDDHGIIWKSLTAGPGKPISFAKVLGHLNTEILACVADCLEEMISVSETTLTAEEQLAQATRVVAREWISTFHEIYNKYELCPCCSGKKIRFCCGTPQ